MSSSNNPKLRWPLDIRYEEFESKKLIVLSCPLGITREPLVLVAGIGPVLALFEGKLSVDEIAAQFATAGVTTPLVEELARLLDQHLLLEGPRYEEERKKVVEGFIQSPVREAALAGLSYPAEKEALSTLVHGFVNAQRLNSNILEALELDATGSKKLQLTTLVSPHIDYRRGGICYGEGYRALKGQHHQTYLLIGTAHQYAKGLFHLSAKDFATPLGILPSDTDAVAQLAAEYGIERSFNEELLHRREHSLELQTPFLYATRSAVKIIPVLVGGFHQMVAAGKAPEQFEEYDAFVAALVKLFKTSPTPIGILAGVDMAHIGRNFGDTFELTPDKMEEIRSRDALYLDTLIHQDKKRLFAHIAEDNDQRRICGFPTMYTVIDLLDRLEIKYKATLFGYHQAVDVPRGCAVTFAAMGFYSDAAH